MSKLIAFLRDDSGGEVSPAGNIVTRAGLVIAAAALLYANGGFGAKGTDKDDTVLILLTFPLYALAFGMLVLAVARTRFKYSNLLILIAVLLSLFSFDYTSLAKSPRIYRTDVIAYTHISARLVLDGKNPYSVRDREFMREKEKDLGGNAGLSFDVNGNLIDHLLNYPAGHLLPYVGAMALGVDDMRWLPALSLLGVIIVLWLAAPPILRPLAALPILVSPETSYLHPFGGISDATWLLPLTCSAVALTSGRYSLAAVAYGVGAATKQQTWLLAPFLLIWLWRESSGLEPRQRLAFIASFGGISAGVFILINLPFIIWQFPDWLSSVLYPFTSNQIIMGSGFSMLTHGGVVGWDRSMYSAVSLSVFAVLLFAYFRFYINLKYALWLLPGLVFWFAHRSLTSYWVYLSPLMLVSLFAIWREQQALSTASDSGIDAESAPEPAFPA